MIFTTSWDDGRKEDMQLAALLDEYGATGTFYVSPPSTHDHPALSNDEIRLLSQRHEVGAHSMTHPRLTRMSSADARREIVESKKWIEGITGKSCDMFCYPYGDENSAIRALAKEAVYRGARTVEQLQFASSDPFGMPTTLQIYPFPLRRKFTRWWHAFDLFPRLRIFFPQMLSFKLPPTAALSWLNLAKSLFLYAQKTNQPFFHLWGHSWEVTKYGMWTDLEKFLKFVNSQPNVTYTWNSGLLSSR
ncbi:polysaccharide deacetylase family protein [Candidatus Peregrinibacteria bacterium]|nr:polysaccharide deacetylase family protein [Candidatus Peregrinibacteria bacterium]